MPADNIGKAMTLIREISDDVHKETGRIEKKKSFSKDDENHLDNMASVEASLIATTRIISEGDISSVKWMKSKTKRRR
jgi:hypothetical protein